MKIALWSVSAILGALSLTVIFLNYGIWLKSRNWKPGDKHVSMIPIVGGLLGYFALRFTHFAAHPQPGWEQYAWLPVLLDPGCYIVGIILVPLELILQRLNRKNVSQDS